MNSADLESLSFLEKNNLVFPILWRNNRYWVPTKKGREYIEKNSPIRKLN